MTGTNESTNVQLGRYLGLFEATMIGVGAMIGAGIFVLTGLAAGNAGPAAILAFGLNGIVTLFTALSYAELSSAIPEAGGGYSFVKKLMPNAVAFISGWMLWFAYVVACSLYAKGFGSYFLEFFHRYVPVVTNTLVGLFGHELAVSFLTVLIGVAFIAINIVGAHASGQTENVMTIGKILILAIFIGFGMKAVYYDPALTANNFTPFMPFGTTGIVSAMGLTFIAFEGYDLIATVSEEVVDPETTIPRAILYSLGITIAIYLLVVFVSIGAVPPEGGTPTWKMLGNYGEIGIVQAAASFMPRFGVVLVLGGGVFATLSALNATVLASSRVAFSMGRDWMLPNVLSKIHSSRRTPVTAILLSGGLFLLVAVFFPLETIGTASSLLFLLTFSLVNVAHMIYRNRNTGSAPPFRVPFYPVTPVLGVLTCVGLSVFQLYHAPAAALIAVGWTGLGFATYFAFFSRQASISDVTKVMESEELRDLKKMKRYRVLTPVSNPEAVDSLIDFGGTIARASGGDLVGLSVVELPDVTSYSEADPFLEQGQQTLEEAQRAALRREVEFSSILKVGRQVGSEIMDTARANDADVILMGYKKDEDPMENSVIEAVVVHQPCDVAILKPAAEEKPLENVLVPIAGRDVHDRLKARIVHSLTRGTDCDVTFMTVIPEEATSEDRQGAERRLRRAVDLYNLPGARTRVELSDDTAEAIIRAAGEMDLVLLGMQEEPWFESFFFGKLTQRVASRVACSVLLTKSHEPERSYLKQWLGLGSDRPQEPEESPLQNKD